MVIAYLSVGLRSQSGVSLSDDSHSKTIEVAVSALHGHRSLLIGLRDPARRLRTPETASVDDGKPAFAVFFNVVGRKMVWTATQEAPRTNLSSRLSNGRSFLRSASLLIVLLLATFWLVTLTNSPARAATVSSMTSLTYDEIGTTLLTGPTTSKGAFVVSSVLSPKSLDSTLVAIDTSQVSYQTDVSLLLGSKAVSADERTV